MGLERKTEPESIRLYRSGVAARMAGVLVETLRVWERRHSVVRPALTEDAAAFVENVKHLCGASRATVFYRFAPSTMIRRLRAAGNAVARAMLEMSLTRVATGKGFLQSLSSPPS